MPKTKSLLQQATQFEANTPEVVAEVIEGELVAIHLGDGYYYHGNTLGSYIWTLLTHHYSVAEIAEQLAKLSGRSVTEMSALVNEYLAKLLQEKLIRVSGKKAILPLEIPLEPLINLEVPTLKKHADMKELLLLDPIHDVGDGSWPLKDVR